MYQHIFPSSWNIDQNNNIFPTHGSGEIFPVVQNDFVIECEYTTGYFANILQNCKVYQKIPRYIMSWVYMTTILSEYLWYCLEKKVL